MNKKTSVFMKHTVDILNSYIPFLTDISGEDEVYYRSETNKVVVDLFAEDRISSQELSDECFELAEVFVDHLEKNGVSYNDCLLELYWNKKFSCPEPYIGIYEADPDGRYYDYYDGIKPSYYISFQEPKDWRHYTLSSFLKHLCMIFGSKDSLSITTQELMELLEKTEKVHPRWNSFVGKREQVTLPCLDQIENVLEAIAIDASKVRKLFYYFYGNQDEVIVIPHVLEAGDPYSMVEYYLMNIHDTFKDPKIEYPETLSVKRLKNNCIDLVFGDWTIRISVKSVPGGSKGWNLKLSWKYLKIPKYVPYYLIKNQQN